MNRLRRNLSGAFLVAVGLTASAASARFPISTAQIADALNGNGFSVTAEQIVLPFAVMSSNAAPSLQVQTFDKLPDHTTRVRLKCSDSSACLPFYVKLPAGTQIPEEAISPESAQKTLHQLPNANRSAAVLVHAGSPATLMIEGGHVHIRIPVICTESGALGARVRARENGQMFTGQVVEAGVLKATL